MKTEYEQRIINWMNKKKFIGMEAKILSEDKKKALKIQKYVLKVASLFMDVPVSISVNSFSAGLFGSENEFRDALSKLSEITCLIGASMGCVLLWIDGDQYDWQEIKSLVKKAFKDSEDIQILLRLVPHTPFFVYPIFVFTNLNRFNDIINQDIDSLPVQSNIFWTDRHVLPAFIDTNNKIIKWCKLKGIRGTMETVTGYPINKVVNIFTSKEISPRPLKNQDIEDIF